MRTPVTLPMIGVASIHSLGMVFGGAAFGDANTTWPQANMAILVPFTFWSSEKVYTLGIINASTINGNIDIGIYDDRLDLVVSKGTTAHAGANAPQFLDIADTVIAPGRYFVALASSSSTAGFVSWSPGSGARAHSLGTMMHIGALPLPAHINPRPNVYNYIPSLCLGLRSTPN
jgi:hypothetical protein